MIIHRTFAAAVAILGFAVPAAAQAQQDLRSPDTRDTAGAITAPKQDLRSPDARDAVNPGVGGAGTVRSIPPASEPAARVVGGGEGGGVHWGTIALGLVPSVLVVVGLAALMGRRSRRGGGGGGNAEVGGGAPPTGGGRAGGPHGGGPRRAGE